MSTAAFVIALLTMSLLPSAFAQDPGSAQPVSFPSIRGASIELAGFLRRPDGAGPFPAVILLHGSAGNWRGVDSRWGRRLVTWGYVALTVDSYGPRGIKSVFGRFDRDDPPDHKFDSYAALEFLSAQPYVLADRVAVLGESGGGTMVLIGAAKGVIEQDFPRKFRAAVALYPECSTVHKPMSLPTLVLIGELDDFNLAQHCKDLAFGRRAWLWHRNPPDEKVHLTVFPGVYHAFDNPAFQNGQRLLGTHWLEYNADAAERSVEEIRRFLHDRFGG
jgi:dienelactone hydrolase